METPELIWHYTTRDGLKGIVESRSLWATSILYMNDSAEFHHVAAVICEWFESQKANDEKEQLFFEFLKGYLASHPATLGGASTHVVSFSELCDDLSQWRAYCPKGGYCVGFNSSTLEKIAERQGYRLENCIYEPADKLAVVRPTLEKALRQFRDDKAKVCLDQIRTAVQNPRGKLPPLLSSLGAEIFNKAQALGATLKHEAFRGEREWRLVSTKTTDGTRLEFRSGASMLVPYRQFRLEAEKNEASVNRICVGPGPNQTLDTHAVASLMLSREVMHAGITSSRIPYRNW